MVDQCVYISSPSVYSWNCTNGEQCSDEIGCCPASGSCTAAVTPTGILSSRLPNLTPDPTTTTSTTSRSTSLPVGGNAQGLGTTGSPSPTAGAISNHGSSNTVAIVVGAVVGVVGLLLIIAIVLFLLLLRRKRKTRQQKDEQQISPSNYDASKMATASGPYDTQGYGTSVDKIPNDRPGYDIETKVFPFVVKSEGTAELAATQANNAAELSGTGYAQTGLNAGPVAELDTPSNLGSARRHPYESREMEG